MSSLFSNFPTHFADGSDDRNNQQTAGFLPPSSSTANWPSNSNSPALNSSNSITTPAESVLSIHYSSDFNEFEPGDDGCFANTDFDAVGGNPPSLSNDLLVNNLTENLVNFSLPASEAPGESATTVLDAFYATPDHLLHASKTYLISPDQTPYLPTSSPHEHSPAFVAASSASGNVAFANTFGGPLDSAASRQLITQSPAGELPYSNSFAASDATARLTPDTTSSGESRGNTYHGDFAPDEIPPGFLPAAAPPMASQNPFVTISHWGHDTISSATGTSNAAPEAAPSSGHHNQHGLWFSHHAARHAGPGGIGPSNRSKTEIKTSIDEAEKARKLETQNTAVSHWLDSANKEEYPDDDNVSPRDRDSMFEGVSDREFEAGGETKNVEKPGRTYILDSNQSMTSVDREILASNETWDDAPTPLHIREGPLSARQNQTSANAMAKFEKMCHDNESFLSRAATWGTRRRSLPSIAEIEGITSGNIFKKLSLNRGDARRPSIFENFRTLVRKTSTSQKRGRHADDETSPEMDSRSRGPSFEEARRDSSTLAPPLMQVMSRGKQSPPSINSALASIGSSAASIATAHARKGSVSRLSNIGTANLSPPLPAPKSPLLKVSNSLRRPRSKSEVAKATAPNIIRLLKATGGPPVAKLAGGNISASVTPVVSSMSFMSGTSPSGLTPIKIPSSGTALGDFDDDDDDDDEMLEDGYFKVESEKLIDRITPDVDGFRELVLGLNRDIAEENKFLVDRIAYHQSQRYKMLLNSRIKHLGLIKGGNCPNHNNCIGVGGTAIPVDRREFRHDPSAYDVSDIDDLASPLDGAITVESFPKHIPMPPTTTLPAWFECQLCFQFKKFQKPSDWTKHVHEDVQPFTCTWDRCREPKMFKRKADWVRHENEGHRHLEWWTCNVDECQHTCYRRDNFLQHLVREHKFPEPKHKTKAAIKKAGATDPTWQRVELCHAETTARPQDEPCRFCGNTFPTWKKLTVHLAKHMEQISLPVLRLVERKEVDADTIISPVQEPPPREFPVVSGPFAEPGEAQPQSLMPSRLSPSMMSLPRQAASSGGFHAGAGHLGAAVGYASGSMDANAFGFLGSAAQIQTYFGQPQQAGPAAGQAQQQFVGSAGLAAMQGLDLAVPVTAGSFGSPTVYDHNQMPVTTTRGFLAATGGQYISEPPGVDVTAAFQGLIGMGGNALGLQPSLGEQMSFDAMVNASVGDRQFTPHGSTSPYGHSPHPSQGGQFYQG